MSQIFDSLRRGREPSPRQPSRRTAQADAVLATLGYTPPRYSRTYRFAVAISVVAAFAVVGWLAWRTYVVDADRTAPPRPMSPLSAVNRAPVPTPSPAPSNTGPVDGSKPEADANRLTTTTPIVGQPPSLLHSQPASPRSIPDSAPAKGIPSVAVPSAAAGSSNADSGSAIRDPGSRPTDSGTRVPDSGSRITQPGAIVPPSDLSIALYFHRAGEFDNALRYYRLVLERDELNAQAHNNLGLLYQERRLLQDSARELKRALAIEPRNADTHNNYGVTLLLLGRIDEAVAQFQTALSLEPGSLDALVNLGLAQRDLGQLDTAKETLLRALNLAPENAAAHYNLAQLYDQTNEPARAVEHYRRFLEHAGAEHADRRAAVRARITALSRFRE